MEQYEDIGYLIAFIFLVMVLCTLYLVITGQLVGYAYLMCLMGLLFAQKVINSEE